MAEQHGGTHTVFFPPMQKQQRSVRNTTPPADDLSMPAPPTNALDCFAKAIHDCAIVRDKLAQLVFSENRHGDLFAALSASRRLQAEIEKLIEAEERS